MIRRYGPLAAISILALWPCGAAADMALNHVILDFATPTERRNDIEVTNRSNTEPLYVVVEPAEIVNPGGKQEVRRSEPDPERLGLLATPVRLILEPGEAKIVRIALLKDPLPDRDRIFRVTIKPVAGRIEAPKSVVKVLIGYDVLVIQRPAQIVEGLRHERNGADVVFRNEGNTNVLLFDGKQCDGTNKNCRLLETKRIYAGGEWRLRLPRPGPFNYLVTVGTQTTLKTFD